MPEEQNYTKAELLEMILSIASLIPGKEYGEQVRGLLVDLAHTVYEAVKDGFTTVDDTFTEPEQGADAFELGKILFGGTDHGNKTPRISSFYDIREQLNPAGTTFDIRYMPRNSFIFYAVKVDGAQKILGLPSGIDSGNVCVIRRPLNFYENMSLYLVFQCKEYDVYTFDRVVAGFYVESGTDDLAPIQWTEIPLNHGTHHASPVDIDNITTLGCWWSQTNYPENADPYKTITNFPFKAGFLFAVPVGSDIVMQIAFRSRFCDPPKIRFRYKNSSNELVWTSFDNIGKLTLAGSLLSNLDARNNDWLITDFSENDGWYTLEGNLIYQSIHGTNLKHSQRIPVYPGKHLFGMWFGGNPPQPCGGAFFDINGDWLAPIKFPYGDDQSGVNVTEKAYDLPDVTSTGRDPSNPYYANGLVYSKFWEIAVPTDAYYIVLNLKNIPDVNHYIYPRSLSTLPIVGETGTGNKIWRRNDPQRAIKKSRKLYIIGPSTLAINRSYQRIYDAKTAPPAQASDLDLGVICGFQEYLAPYYDEIVSLGFSGKSQKFIYDEINTNAYIEAGHVTNTLDDADEVIIMSNANGPGIIGSETDDDPNTYCGATNKLIDLILSKNSGHAVRIYLATGFIRVGEGKSDHEKSLLRNEKYRKIAKRRNLGIIDISRSGISYNNYKYYSYDSWLNTTLKPYSPYGMHLNNEGNRILGNVILQALLNDGDVSLPGNTDEESYRLSTVETADLNGDEFDTSAGDWLSNKYVNDNDGEIYSTLTNNVSATSKLLAVPYDCVLKIHGCIGCKVARFNANRGKIEVISFDTAKTINVSSENTAFIRLQWPGNADAAKQNCIIRKSYTDGRVVRLDETKKNIADTSYNTSVATYAPGDPEANPPIADVKNNPVALADTSGAPFRRLSITPPAGSETETKLTVCGKNIFNMMDYESMGLDQPQYNQWDYSISAGSIIRSGIRFVFAPKAGTVRIIPKDEGGEATENTISAHSIFGDAYKLAIDDGSSTTHIYVNYKFRFATDTWVTVSDNAKYPVKHNFGVQMRVHDGRSFFTVTEGGLTFKAIANTTYGVYFFVQKGWSGDITYRPQIEIGTHATEFERYTGYDVSDSSVKENEFEMADTDASRLSPNDNLTAIFDPQNQEIYIKCKAVNSAGYRLVVPYTSTHYDLSDPHNIIPTDKVNGSSYSYIVRITGIDGYVYFGGIPKKYKGMILGQVSDGHGAPQVDTGDGLFLYTKAGREYGYRILLTNIAEFEDTIRPVIVSAPDISYAHSRLGTTTLYTNDGSGITVEASKKSVTEKIEGSKEITDAINIITGGRINGTPYPRKPYVSFIDDDATSAALVEEYYNIMHGKGIVGGYAVETDNVAAGGDTLKNMLLNYERDGFDCLYHCKHQISYTYMNASSISDMTNHNYRYVMGNSVYAYIYKHVDSVFKMTNHAYKYVMNNRVYAYIYKHVDSVSQMTNHSYEYVMNNRVYAWNTTIENWEDIGAYVEADGWRDEGAYVEAEGWRDIGPYTFVTIPPEGIENTWYFVDGANGDVRATGSPYSVNKSRNNFVDGLRDMKEMGFSNYNYWVTPYGVNNEDMKNIAKKYGMKCLVSYPSNVYLYHNYITRYGNVGKWDVPRVHWQYEASGVTTQRCKKIADACAADNGWLILTTHVNSWSYDPTTRAATKTSFESLIDYVKDTLHMEVVPFSVGFETFKPYLDMHDLLK